MKKNILLFLKGIAMGVCDAIPGISGGTIALITGIYKELIDAVSSFSHKTFGELYVFFSAKKNKKKRARKSLQKYNFPFLGTLIAGILIALLATSWVMDFLLTSFRSFTFAFFFGLILASAILLYKKIPKHHISSLPLFFLGVFIGACFAFLPSINVLPQAWFIFLAGFIAISALFLPGISGSFILVLLGLYEFMITAIKYPFSNLGTIFLFLFGALFGVLIISRVIKWLFVKDESKTLYALLGLVIGALTVPFKEVILVESISWLVVVFALLGLGIALGIDHLGRRKK